MKGNILNFEKTTNSGLISGHDGKRYKFVMQDWKTGSVVPVAGLEVDFEASEDKAIDIIVLQQGVGDKSRLTYILLGLFFGALGIHNFYAGYKNKAITQLLLTLLSFPLMLLLIGVFTVWISPIWALIEIIIITKDSDGKSFV